MFSASTERATFFSLHDKRGYDGLNHAGVLPSFTGVAVHDGFKPYRDYTQLTHALCNVHHLRELLGVIGPAAGDPRQESAVRRGPVPIRKLQTIVAGTHRHAGRDRLQARAADTHPERLRADRRPSGKHANPGRDESRPANAR